MKKLFTLFALLAVFMGANAKEIVDAEVNFSDYTDISQVKFAGWGGSESAFARLSIQDGCLHFESEVATDPGWDCQFFPIGFGGNAEVGVTYTLHFKVKGSVTQNISALGFGLTPYGQFPITTEWVEGTYDYTATGTSGDILFQCGDYVGYWDIAYLKITHEGKEEKPATWQEWLTSDGQPVVVETTPAAIPSWRGNAEFGSWPEWALAKTDEGINISWRGDRTGEICAWALTMGRNEDNLDGQDGRARPFPADIEEIDGGHAFVVDATQCAIIPLPADNPDANSFKWANQFWIQSPKGWKEGTEVKLHFRYKATKNVKSATQIHKEHPSDYLHWQAIGSIEFTTEWKEYDGKFTIDSNMANGWSVAFNLQDGLSSPDEFEPVKFYFDDLSWETMVLDEGFFVAGSNATTGIEYDFDTATELEYDGAADAYVATVGTVGHSDTWVNEVMISTVRGYDKAFKSATIKPSGSIIGDDDSNWLDYTAGSNAKIKLPAAGVWQIFVAPDETDASKGQVLFMLVEGEELKKPVDIITFVVEIVINGVERDWLPADADGNPQEAEIGNGNTWDNQFFIVANRVLEPGEVTVIAFDCVATLAAKTLTGTHAMPGEYRKDAFGDVDFPAADDGVIEHIEREYVIPSTTWGNEPITDAQSISFDMAVIKEANDYTIKNVQWYLKDATLNGAGQTMENLINATGTDNFFVKIGAGNAVVPLGIDNVINTTTTGSKYIYNLSGQRVSKDYKGVVIINGRKVVQK